MQEYQVGEKDLWKYWKFSKEFLSRCAEGGHEE